MTLKDFHGGSIPSDLPLPSAPGVAVRAPDRSGYERASPWGNPVGRADPRVRPNSSSAIRHFDDKTPFLPQTAHIGRNFDEDERTPLDGGSAPRRIVSDESFRVSANRVELKPETLAIGKGFSRNGSAPVSQITGGAVNSYSGKVSGAKQNGVSSQNFVGNAGQSTSGSYANAWTSRKEGAMMGATEQGQSAWSEQSAVSKLAHASALDKVSSGKWQSKLSVPYQADVEVVRPSEENSLRKDYDDNRFNSVDAVGAREYSDAMLARDADRSLNIVDRVQVSRKELPDYERSHDFSHFDARERKLAGHGEGAQPARLGSKLVGSEVTPSEVTERPKLKLLPRTKPLDTEPLTIDPKQVQRQLSGSALSHAVVVNDSPGAKSPSKPNSFGGESMNQSMDRPKLNLKPRSQPIEQLERNFEKERVKYDAPRAEKIHEQAAVNHRFEKTEKPSYSDQRTGRKFESNHRMESERVEAQKRSWHNENRRQPQQQQQERRPSPETWRKPIEEPKPSSPDTTSRPYGKAASAVELAQAFSKSRSETDERHREPRSLPGSQTQVPFSRLTGPTPTSKTQLNGY